MSAIVRCGLRSSRFCLLAFCSSLVCYAARVLCSITNLLWAAPQAKVVFLCPPSLTETNGQNMCNWARDYYIPVYLKHLQMVSCAVPAIAELPTDICGFHHARRPFVADVDGAAAWGTGWTSGAFQRHMEIAQRAGNRDHDTRLHHGHDAGR